MTAALIVLALAFAWSIGAHYTGAVMGMPHALHTIGAWRALLLMAPLTFDGGPHRRVLPAMVPGGRPTQA